MRTRTFTLIIDGKTPSVNHSYIPLKGGRLIQNKEVKNFKIMVSWLAKKEMQAQLIGITENPVSCTIKIYYPTRRGDATNANKALLDALEGILYKNDSQIGDNSNPKLGLHTFYFRTEKHKDKLNPRIVCNFELIYD